MLPSLPFNLKQLKKDIIYNGHKTLTKKEVDNIIREFKLEKRCKRYYNNLKQIIADNTYISAKKTLRVDMKYNNKYYVFELNYDNKNVFEKIIKPLPEKFLKIKLRLSEYIYKKLLSRLKNKVNMEERIFNVLLRYRTLRSLGQQLAVENKFYETIRSNFGFNFELFASSINAYFDNYCSLFYDVEKYFGSNGSFFLTNIQQGNYVANPPFDGNIMKYMAIYLKKALESNTKLNVLVVIPYRTGYVYTPYEILKDKIIYEKVISKEKAGFHNYSRIEYPTAIYLLLVSNNNEIDLTEFDKVVEKHYFV